jgi:hypothetical protein
MILLALAVFSSPVAPHSTLDLTAAHHGAMQPAAPRDAFVAWTRHGAETGVEPSEPERLAPTTVSSSRGPRRVSANCCSRRRLALAPYSSVSAGEVRVLVLRV